MKKLSTLLAFYAFVSLALFSCSTSKNAVVNNKPDNEAAREISTNNFVQFQDGTIRSFSTLKLVTGILVTPHLLADGNIVIKEQDIKAYQNSEHYAISQKIFNSGRKTYVVKETLPGFAIRIISGKINVYKKTIYNGERAVQKYFIQNGNDGEIVAYSREAMNELLKGNTEVLNYFNNNSDKTSFIKKLQTTISLFNYAMAVTKN